MGAQHLMENHKSRENWSSMSNATIEIFLKHREVTLQLRCLRGFDEEIVKITNKGFMK